MPDTHYAFTVGKDGLVKYWDADRWELLLTLEGHKAEVWSPTRAPDIMLAACPAFQSTMRHATNSHISGDTTQ